MDTVAKYASNNVQTLISHDNRAALATFKDLSQQIAKEKASLPTKPTPQESSALERNLIKCESVGAIIDVIADFKTANLIGKDGQLHSKEGILSKLKTLNETQISSLMETFENDKAHRTNNLERALIAHGIPDEFGLRDQVMAAVANQATMKSMLKAVSAITGVGLSTVKERDKELNLEMHLNIHQEKKNPATIANYLNLQKALQKMGIKVEEVQDKYERIPQMVIRFASNAGKMAHPNFIAELNKLYRIEAFSSSIGACESPEEVIAALRAFPEEHILDSRGAPLAKIDIIDQLMYLTDKEKSNRWLTSTLERDSALHTIDLDAYLSSHFVTNNYGLRAKFIETVANQAKLNKLYDAVAPLIGNKNISTQGMKINIEQNPADKQAMENYNCLKNALKDNGVKFEEVATGSGKMQMVIELKANKKLSAEFARNLANSFEQYAPKRSTPVAPLNPPPSVNLESQKPPPVNNGGPPPPPSKAPPPPPPRSFKDAPPNVAPPPIGFSIASHELNSHHSSDHQQLKDEVKKPNDLDRRRRGGPSHAP